MSLVSRGLGFALLAGSPWCISQSVPTDLQPHQHITAGEARDLSCKALAAKTKLSKKDKAFKASSCDKDHSTPNRTEEDIQHSEKALAALLQSSWHKYEAATKAIRVQFVLDSANAESLPSRDQARLLSASYYKIDADTAIRTIVSSCEKLQTALYNEGLEGLGAYVGATIDGLKKDLSVDETITVRKSLRTADGMYATLAALKNRLSVSPIIKSIPTGATITLATKRQIAGHEAEYFGKTDSRAIRIYRGIYTYTIYADGYSAGVAELNLIDNQADEIFCAVRPELSSLACAAH